MLPVPISLNLPAATDETLRRTREIEAADRLLPQAHVRFEHMFWAGMYARTVHIPAGTRLTSVLIKIPTIVVVNGDVLVYDGSPEPLHLVGHKIVSASAGRQTVYLAQAATSITMFFPTTATTVAEAEREFTDEAERLLK